MQPSLKNPRKHFGEYQPWVVILKSYDLLTMKIRHDNPKHQKLAKQYVKNDHNRFWELPRKGQTYKHFVRNFRQYLRNFGRNLEHLRKYGRKLHKNLLFCPVNSTFIKRLT
jgi:hypothetical protein